MIKFLLFLLNLITSRTSRRLILPSSSLVIQSSDPNEVLVLEAQKWIGTREVGENGGEVVERFQRAVNPKPNHESWCADFVIFCIQEVETKLGVKSKIARSELCSAVWAASPESMRVSAPTPGCVVVWEHYSTQLGHMGIVQSLRSDGNMNTIEGNTGPGAGIVREGDGVYCRIRDTKGTSTMKVLGFLKPF